MNQKIVGPLGPWGTFQVSVACTPVTSAPVTSNVASVVRLCGLILHCYGVGWPEISLRSLKHIVQKVDDKSSPYEQSSILRSRNASLYIMLHATVFGE